MSQNHDLAELELLYQTQLKIIGEMERKIAQLQQITDVLFEITPAGPTKNSLWRKYQNLKKHKPHEPLEGISGM